VDVDALAQDRWMSIGDGGADVVADVAAPGVERRGEVVPDGDASEVFVAVDPPESGGWDVPGGSWGARVRIGDDGGEVVGEGGGVITGGASSANSVMAARNEVWTRRCGVISSGIGALSVPGCVVFHRYVRLRSGVAGRRRSAVPGGSRRAGIRASTRRRSRTRSVRPARAGIRTCGARRRYG
jgi:hypothetical protein